MRLLYFAFSIACVSSLATAQARDSSARSEIATSGRGEVHVTPDQAVMTVSVETHSPSAAAAAQDNAARLMRTIAALRAAGVDSPQITTAGYSLSQDYEKNRPSGFAARNGLRVEVRRIADIGKLIDVALTAGATSVGQVQFVRADTREARRSALALAVAEARRDAEVLAQAAGGTLGKLVYLTSGVSVPVGRENSNYAQLSSVVVTGASVATPIMPGELTISAVASARWLFVSR
jgi:uncharacterized protein YggE